MKKVCLKHINPGEFEELEKFFEDIGASYTEELENKLDIAVTSFSDEKIENAKQGVNLQQVSDLKSFLSNGGWGQFDLNLLKTDFPRAIFKRFVTGGGALQVEQSFSDGFIANKTCKILDDGSLGYHLDLITNLAREHDFNFINVRSACLQLLSFAQYLSLEQISDLPIEVDYGCSDQSYFVQIHFQTEGFYLEHILDAFQSKESKNPYSSLLKEALDSSDLLEVYSLERAKRLVLCGIWTKNETVSFPSLLVHQIPKFETEEFKVLSETERTKLEMKKELTSSNASRVGKKPSKLQSKGLKEGKDVFKMKRIHNELLEAKGDRSLDDIEDIQSFIQDSLDDELVVDLSDMEFDFLGEALGDPGLVEELDDSIEVVKGSLDQDDYLEGIALSIDDLELEDLDFIGGEFSFDDENTLVKGSGEGNISDVSKMSREGEEDLSGATLVKGNGEGDVSDISKMSREGEEDLSENTLVKGSGEGNISDISKMSRSDEESLSEATLVKGDGEGNISDVQRAKGESLDSESESENVLVKGQGEENIKDEAQRISLDGDDESDVMRVQGSQLEGNDDTQVISSTQEKEGRTVVKGVTRKYNRETWKVKRLEVAEKANKLVKELHEQNIDLPEIDLQVQELFMDELGIDEEAAAGLTEKVSMKAAERAASSSSESLDAIQARLELEKLRNQVARKDDQTRRMKRVIDGLKDSYGKLQTRYNEATTTKSILSDPDADVNSDLVNQISAANRDKAELERRANTKEKDFENWKQKFQDKNVKESKQRELYLNELSQENEKLSAEMNKINTTFKKLGSCMEMKDVLQLFNGLVDNQILEKVSSQILSGSPDLVAQLQKEKEEAGGANRVAILEKNNQIEKLNEEVRKGNDKTKTLNMSLKSFEQKNNFLTAQIDKLKSEMTKMKAAVKKGGNSKQAEQKIRLLEKNLQKYQDTNRKSVNELGEKKTELHKAKLENKTMALKIKDLERKLNAALKKAA